MLNKKDYKIKSRFYHCSNLSPTQILTLDADIFHHIIKVLRAKDNDYLTLFNERDGEFLVKIISIEKKSLKAITIEKIRSYEKSNFNLHLAFAPLKKEATDIVFEKACELGVNTLSNVLTAYSNNKPIEPYKVKQKLISSSQQCGRLDIPTFLPPLSLKNFLEEYQDATIFWAYEQQTDITLSAYLKNHMAIKDPIFLIGAEGGFSPEEAILLKNSANVIPIHFNGNTLRAETACIAALIYFQIISCNF